MSYLINWPSEQIDPHAQVIDRQFNWYTDVRGFFLEYALFFTIASLSYYPLMCLGVRLMKNRQSFDCKIPLFLWNMFLSIFSTVGAISLSKILYSQLTTLSLVDSICDHKTPYTSESAYFLWLFVISKVFEWVDTIFLILKKKNIRFLHWFHHLVTFLYTWHSSLFSYRVDAIMFFGGFINFFVHGIMYAYYGFAGIGIKFPYSTIITYLQTIQMYVCLIITLTSALKCESAWQENWHGLLFCLVMYGSYAFMFTKLLLSKLKTKIQ
ncbi:GNS1/SUR4 family [seawater metagenome]|uniref:GNS1/SUR4 family n=1 Tax=seawater metagenome TaxID=1561972 RepID=A0A5E8CH98_9ZZZZ